MSEENSQKISRVNFFKKNTTLVEIYYITTGNMNCSTLAIYKRFSMKFDSNVKLSYSFFPKMSPVLLISTSSWRPFQSMYWLNFLFTGNCKFLNCFFSSSYKYFVFWNRNQISSSCFFSSCEQQNKTLMRIITQIGMNKDLKM